MVHQADPHEEHSASVTVLILVAIWPAGSGADALAQGASANGGRHLLQNVVKECTASGTVSASCIAQAIAILGNADATAIVKAINLNGPASAAGLANAFAVGGDATANSDVTAISGR